MGLEMPERGLLFAACSAWGDLIKFVNGVNVSGNLICLVYKIIEH